MNHICIVEDDEFIRDGLESILKAENFNVKSFGSISESRIYLKDNIPALMILDVLLPDGNGFEFCKEIRRNMNFPILFLTCCDEEYNTVRGLDSGGDDYVTKPFRVKELMSRIKALLRRSNQYTNNDYEMASSDDIVVDWERYCVYVFGKNIYLTPTEFQIFGTLIKNKGRLVTRQILIEKIWDFEGDFIDENTLNVHISSLRKKLKDKGKMIQTHRGIGYSAF